MAKINNENINDVQNDDEVITAVKEETIKERYTNLPTWKKIVYPVGGVLTLALAGYGFFKLLKKGKVKEAKEVVGAVAEQVTENVPEMITENVPEVVAENTVNF